MYSIASLAALILATATIFSVRWSRDDFSPHTFGMKPIVLPDGQKLYLKREVGLHYDRTSLSLNGDRCIGPNEASDYVFSSSGAGEFPLYYLSGQNGITVYDSSLNSPTRTIWTIRIKQERLLNESYFGGGEEDYHARGISNVEIPLSELSACQRKN